MVEEITVEKTVLTTSLSETTSDQFDPALVDLSLEEEVTYQIEITVPESSMTNFVVTDTLPPYFEAISGALISDDGMTHSFTGATLIDSDADGIEETVTFDFGNVSNNSNDNDTERFILTVTALVLNDSNVASGTGHTNTVSADYDENPNVPYTDTEVVDVLIPDVSIVKDVTPIVAFPGDSLTYTITITNTSGAPAYDVTVTDPLLTTVTATGDFATDGLDNDGDGTVDEADEAVGAFYDSTLDAFTWNFTNTANPKLQMLGVGDSFTIQFNATVDASATPNSVHPNTATLEFYTAPDNPSARAFGPRTSVSKSDPAEVTVPFDSSVVKNIRTGVTDYRVGGVVPYEIIITLQEGTINPLTVQDILPAGLAYIPGTFSLTVDPAITVATTPTDFATITLASATITGGQTQTLDLSFGQVTNNDTNSATDEQITIWFDAAVMNTADNFDGQTQVNEVTATFGSAGAVGPVYAPAVTIHEPPLTVDVTTNYTTGSTVIYTVEIANNGTDAADHAYDLDLWTLLPPELTYVGNVTLLNGGAAPVTDSSILPNVHWTIADLPILYNATNPYTFTFEATINPTATAGQVITLPMDLLWTSQSGAIGTAGELIPGNPLSTERTGDTALGGGTENDYKNTDSVPITVSRPDLQTSDKSITDVDGGNVLPGDTLRYRLMITNTGDLAANNLGITDQLPVQTVGFNWVIAPPAGAIDNSNYTTGGANSRGFIDLSGMTLPPVSSAPLNTLILEYEVQIVANADPSIMIENSMVATADGAVIGEGIEIVGVEMAALDIVKTVFPDTEYNPGETFIYAVTVTNTGNAPSINTTLVDPLPPYVTYQPGTMTVDSATKSDAIDADEADFGGTNANAVTVQLPILAPGDSFVTRFSVKANAVTGQVTTNNVANATDDNGNDVSDNVEVKIGTPTTPPPNPTTTGTTSGSVSGSTTGYVIDYDPPTPPNPPTDPNPPTPPVIEILVPSAPKETPGVTPPPAVKSIVIQHTPQVNDLQRVEEVPQTGVFLDFAIAQSKFSDFNPTDPGYLAAVTLENMGYVRVKSNRKISFDTIATRAELAKLSSLAALEGGSIEVNLNPAYYDVPMNHWASPYIHYAADKGLMNGRQDGSFGVNDAVTLGAASVVLGRAFEVIPHKTNADAHWAEGHVKSLQERNILPTVIADLPYDTELSRRDVFRMLYRLLELRDAQVTDAYFNTMYLTVPSADMYDIPVTRGSVSEPSIWRKQLDDGAAFYQHKTGKNRGKFVAFGHSIPDARIAEQRYAFTNLLGSLNAGDRYSITIGDITHEYEVTLVEKINAEQMDILASFDYGKADMMLFTCDTLDANVRHLFEARMVDSSPAKDIKPIIVD